MSQVAFDTLKFTRRLKEVGVPERQAEAEAEAINDAFSEALNTRVATKEDIQKLKDDMQVFKEEVKKDAQGLKDDMQAFKDEVKADTQGLKDDMQAFKDEVKKDTQGLKDDVTRLDAKIDNVDTKLTAKINLVHWMVGFNLAFTLAMFWKLFSQ